MKKSFAIIMAILMVFALSSAAFASPSPTAEPNTNGRITISNPVAGSTYNVYKIFDNEIINGEYIYTINSSTASTVYAVVSAADSPFALTATETANVYSVSLKDGMTSVDVINFLRDNQDDLGTPVYSHEATASEETLTTGDLDWGYYFVTTTTGAAVTITHNLTNPTVIDKNPSGTDKNIVLYGDNGAETYTKVNEAVLGEYIDFLIEYDATNFDDSMIITSYQIEDVMPDGITLDRDSFRVYVGETELTPASNYITLTSPAGLTANNSFNANIPWATERYEEDAADATERYGWFKKDGNYTATAPATADPASEGYEVYDGTTTAKTYHKIYTPIYATSPQKIKIYYRGYLNDDALIDAANINTAKFNFQEVEPETPSPDSTTPPTPPTPEDHYDDDDNTKPDRPSASTETFTTAITVHKQDVAGNKLTGAKFSLEGTVIYKTFVKANDFFKTTDTSAQGGVTYYYKLDPAVQDIEYVAVPAGFDPFAANADLEAYLTETTVNIDGTDPVVRLTYAMIEDGAHLYRKQATSSVVTTVADYYQEGFVNNDGNITFSDLGEGTYTLTELIAPDGYNLLDTPITITVSFDDQTKTFTYTYTGNTQGDLDPATVPINVVNRQGNPLPETGGIGTKIFYAVGGLLMAGAVIALVTRKKMSVVDD